MGLPSAFSLSIHLYLTYMSEKKYLTLHDPFFDFLDGHGALKTYIAD